MACFSIVNGYLKYISKNKLFLRVDYHALRIKLMLKQFRCLKFTDCHKVVTLIKYQVSNKINRLLFGNSFCIDDNKITIEPFCIYMKYKYLKEPSSIALLKPVGSTICINLPKLDVFLLKKI